MSGSDTDYAAARRDDDGTAVRSTREREDRTGRLIWAPPTSGSRLDGAWWPSTRDPAAELVALLPAAGSHLGGPVRRVSLNLEAWGPDRPGRLRAGGALVRLGWFHTLDPATVTLGRGSDDRVTLLVLPPELDPAKARRLLHRLSSAPRWPDSASVALNGEWDGDGPGGGT
jgi:hypothetical protein